MGMDEHAVMTGGSPAGGQDFAAFRRRNPVRSTDVPAHYRSAQGVHLAQIGRAHV